MAGSKPASPPKRAATIDELYHVAENGKADGDETDRLALPGFSMSVDLFE